MDQGGQALGSLQGFHMHLAVDSHDTQLTNMPDTENCDLV